MRYIISGGGTGGHIFPAISIANAIKARDNQAEILFVGANGRMEMERVPQAGYPIEGLPVRGFDRRKLLKNIGVFIDLMKSISKAKKIIRYFKPDIAIGVGGYASAPTLRAASKFGIITLLQEQNSYAGVTNKLLAAKASKICVAYEGMEKFFPAEKIVLTGNPVRQDLFEISPKAQGAYDFFSFSPKKKTVLVVGGSLGARTINESIAKHLEKLLNNDIQLIWQTGKTYYAQALKSSETYQRSTLIVTDFVSRMDYAYAVADLVVSRAGASSISELCLLGKPVILIPSPNVAEDHQTKNALALVDKNAAVMVRDVDAPKELVHKIIQLMCDDNTRYRLSENIAHLAQKDSANRIADEVFKLIKHSY